MSDKQDKQNPALDTKADDKTQEMAFALYRDAINMRGQSVNPEQLALDAYRRALAFQKLSGQIAAGKITTALETDNARKMIKVPRGYMKDDQQGFEGRIDPTTRQAVYEMVSEDPFAYAPNLPDNHPVNLRFQPRDGITLQDRKASHKSATAPLALGLN